MSFLGRLIFIFFPALQKGIPQTHYKLIIKDNKPACIEADVNYQVAKRFNANPGNCKNVGCNLFKGEYYIPFGGLVRGYSCN